MRKSFVPALLCPILILWIPFITIACGNGSHAQSTTQLSQTSNPTSGTNAGSTTTTTASGSTTSTPTGLPVPPANAQVFDNLQQTPGWQSCNSADCAGGSGAGTYWLAQNQASPSLSGSSMELYNSGVRADALWWLKVGTDDSATNFLWDFYAQVDESSASAAQALEFDAFQFIGGYNYMLGSQCDLGMGRWDVWDAQNAQWDATSVPCKEFEPDTWHHIQWYMQRIAGTQNYKFVTLVVDGTPYAVNQTYSAAYVAGWSDNMGVQYQLDVNATGGGFHEWVDQSTLTVW